MTDIIDVKKKVRDILLNDSAVKDVVNNRVYVGWFDRNYALPCVTVVDPSEIGEVGMLGGAQDEYRAFVQVDVWSKESPLSRDQLTKAIKVALGIKANFLSMQVAGFILGSPSVRVLDEIDLQEPVFRKMLQFPVTYYSDSYA